MALVVWVRSVFLLLFVLRLFLFECENRQKHWNCTKHHTKIDTLLHIEFNWMCLISYFVTLFWLNVCRHLCAISNWSKWQFNWTVLRASHRIGHKIIAVNRCLHINWIHLREFNSFFRIVQLFYGNGSNFMLNISWSGDAFKLARWK